MDSTSSRPSVWDLFSSQRVDVGEDGRLRTKCKACYQVYSNHPILNKFAMFSQEEMQ